jgi:hypothetical protein
MKTGRGVDVDETDWRRGLLGLTGYHTILLGSFLGRPHLGGTWQVYCFHARSGYKLVGLKR